MRKDLSDDLADQAPECGGVELLPELLQRLRVAGLPLGIGELMAARRALAAGLGSGGDEQLKRMLQLLWCKSAGQRAELDARLDGLLAERRSAATRRSEDLQLPPTPEPPTGPPSESIVREPPRLAPEPDPRPAPAIRPLPVRAPDRPPPASGEPSLIAQDPVSRRAMAYAWRYLRRPVKDGPCDLLDLTETVERAARQGFFDCPALCRRTSDHGHLILLMDQGGSMVPFHRLTRDLVQTVREYGPACLDLGYFQNVPSEQVYEDPHRTRPLALDRLLADCTPESAVLVVGDAGAARGGLDQSRFRSTARVLVRIKRLTRCVAWLNPVPKTRWPGSTAALVAVLVPMFAMDEDGFAKAVDVLRGQTAGSRA